jgi:cytochrome c
MLAQLRAQALFAVLLLVAAPAAAELRGHGGPVRSIAVAADGDTVVTGSFDQRAIRWSLREARALTVTRFHQAALDAVLMLPDGGFATAGDDGRIALWEPDGREPRAVLEGHDGKITALALSPDKRRLASAGWDSTIRLWSLEGARGAVLRGHDGPVLSLAFLPDGKLVSAGYDRTLRIWPGAENALPTKVDLPAAVNSLAIAPDGEIAGASADGQLRFFAASGAVRDSVRVSDAPLLSLALSPDGRWLAAAGLRGAAVLLERSSRRVLASMTGPGLPIWSMAFAGGGGPLLTGGSDGVVRRFAVPSGRPLDTLLAAGPSGLPGGADARGAVVFKACAACHALRPGGPPRAGPTLAGLFGRPIASVPGYDYSAALRTMTIVWTPATVAELFRQGPSAYTPGTRMPEQTIGSEEELQALVRFLQEATAP